MVRIYILALVSFWLLAAAAEHASAVTRAAAQGDDCHGPVLETMDGGGYTYVKLDCGQEQIWAAGPQTSVAVGQEVAISKSMPMVDFYSAALDRSFETIYFVARFGSTDAHGTAGSGAAELEEAHRQTGLSAELMDFSGIEPPPGGKSVAEIFESKNELSGQEVLVRGLVVKFSANVMGKNWIHLQDGTGEPGRNDLTITTADSAAVGARVLARGKLTLDLDLGYGYHYDVVIEDASITIE